MMKNEYGGQVMISDNKIFIIVINHKSLMKCIIYDIYTYDDFFHYTLVFAVVITLTPKEMFDCINILSISQLIDMR